MSFPRITVPSTERPGSLLATGLAFGCLGVGLPFALAAKLANPDRTVILLSGDGTFGLNGMEFDTAVRHGIPVVCVIGNDQACPGKGDRIGQTGLCERLDRSDDTASGFQDGGRNVRCVLIGFSAEKRGGSSMEYFKDKIALVTGGASGMGRAVCEQMGRHGATLVVADINHEGAQEVAESILAAGGQARAANLDVTQREDVHDLVNQTAHEHGRLDLIFNNAGIGILGDERDKTLDHWKKIIDVNLLGVLHGTTAAYPLMVKQGFGQIVNMASMAGYIPSPMDAAYGTTKHAVVGLSVSLRDEAADLGVKVNAVCPGFIKTPIIFNTPILNVNFSREEMEENLPEFLFMDVNKAGTAILKGIARNRAMIVFPFHARLAWWLTRLCPPLFDRIGRLQIKSFRKHRIQGGVD